MVSSVGFLEKIRNKAKDEEETPIQHPSPPKNSEFFRLFFLMDDEESIEVVETQEIDFKEVVQRLKRGESIFITRKTTRERDPNPKLIEDAREPWYFTNI